MTNPNPDRIANAMWRLWTNRPVNSWRLGGIYARKRGYHGTRTENQSDWPGDYSISLSLDKRGASDKAAAIDYTMSDAEMRRRTGYLRASALDPDDDRLNSVREFYGTLSGWSVYGLIKTSRTGSWRFSSANSSHLWHIHISVFRADTDNWKRLAPILSVLSGESYAEWAGANDGGTDLIGLKKGDSGQEVMGLQACLVKAGFGPDGGVDGAYGPATSAAVYGMRKAMGSNVDDGDYFSGWAFAQLMEALSMEYAGKDGKDGERGPEGPKGDPGVLTIPDQLSIAGTVDVSTVAG